MTINRKEIQTTIHLINILIRINQVEDITINKNSTFFEPKGIEYDYNFDVIVVFDAYRKPWFFEPAKLKYITIVLKDGEIL